MGDSLKNIWVSVNSDLEYAKSSLQELFYLLPLDTSKEVKAVMEVAEVIQNIPGKVEALYSEAAEEGTQDSFVSSRSWPGREQTRGQEVKSVGNLPRRALNYNYIYCHRRT